MNRFPDTLASALPTMLLWLGASFVAVMLLSRSMKRRREVLTDALKKHVVDTIGVIDEQATNDTPPKS